MTTSIEPEIANMGGAAALPRKNGELVFEEPWQGRVFGIAISLHREGAYDWEEFRQRLISQIQASDCKADENPGYYHSWLAALEGLVMHRGVVNPDELGQRVKEYKSGIRDKVF
jgi:nitrile hydratase accessory protein